MGAANHAQRQETQARKQQHRRLGIPTAGGGVAGDWKDGASYAESQRRRFANLEPSTLEYWQERANSVLFALIPINKDTIHWPGIYACV